MSNDRKFNVKISVKNLKTRECSIENRVISQPNLITQKQLDEIRKQYPNHQLTFLEITEL